MTRQAIKCPVPLSVAERAWWMSKPWYSSFVTTLQECVEAHFRPVPTLMKTLDDHNGGYWVIFVFDRPDQADEFHRRHGGEFVDPPAGYEEFRSVYPE